ncbi:MAG: hypothetical protein CVU11_07425 [Bacteroidetes bacterium HGW-Bacteroidetes-6]|jgi:gliding motility-associated-like protein|nr:MAG: hypothetical protein CVU11_07425 [Bacteroidetes bacterium HGW-Bacteroidetes-6]
MKKFLFSFALFAFLMPLSAQIQVVHDITCYGDTNGALLAVPGFGTAPYIYLWNTGDVSQAVHNLASGAYTVTVTDAMAAINVYSYNLTEPAQIIISYAPADITPSTCDGFNNGGADITVVGGVPGYGYLWSDVQFDSTFYTQDISNVRGGVYRIEVTDAWNCMVFDTIVIPSTDTIPYITTLQEYVCNGLQGTATVRATEAVPGYYFNYEWDTPYVTGSYLTTDTGFIGSVALLAGTYTITITDNQTGCEAYYDFTINQSVTPLVVDETVVHNICDNDVYGSISLGITGGDPMPDYNIAWTGPNSFIATDVIMISGLASGVYNYTVTDDSVCVVNSTVVVHSELGGCFTLPNLVTPNGDGFNDTYFVDGACNYMNFFIQIYDSWGKLVFESTDCNASWDPLGDNAPPNSVYYYMVRLNDGIIEKEYKNSIDVKY